MQIIRINNGLPQVYRVCKATPTNYYTTRTMSLFPRFVANEFAPMFRLMDDYASHVMSTSGRNGSPLAISSSLRSFQPRFDVKESKDTYELHGELPGIDQNDINIEFTDAQTLSIKGRTEHVREEGQRPSGLLEGESEKPRITAGGESNGYHKATVEDETSGVNQTEATKATEAAEAPKERNESNEVAQQQQHQQQPKSEGSRYWVSERSVGQFARSFSFPDRIDQENVRASLKNGILSIVVPKAAAPVSRRINVE